MPDKAIVQQQPPVVEETVERKVPLWAKLALVVCVLFFVALFLAFASSVSSSGGVG